MSGFDQLHPAVQHHVVNSLGWRNLRPLQEAAIEPVLAGEHLLAIAPTASGKTEAAFLPVLSRMLDESWSGLTVLYLCPLRALLNNLHERLSGYAELVGRRVGLWHGDVTTAQRDRLLRDPPDVLLTTPESLESMLVSTRVAQDQWFSGVRVAIVDEAHAFAADDRGWHLLAVLSRVGRLSGREIQRIALSATIGNPDDVLGWLTTGCDGPQRVVNPSSPVAARPDVVIDHVGNLDNAATVISRLHRGAKRLVFVDSRAGAEKLTSALRGHGVTAFVSHGSLGLDERRRTEQAFAEARDCVIVATSTLELGVDIGDLDHVIQIDTPPSVSAFLQRLGRTGRRAGASQNMTILTVSDAGLLSAAGVVLRWGQGQIESTRPPPLPLHLLGQQLLALALQEGQIGRHTWREWYGRSFALGGDVEAAGDTIVDHLLVTGYLVDLGEGMLTIGGVAEAEFGRRHFMELLASFTAPPMFTVMHGRTEVGRVPDETLLVRSPGGGDEKAARVLLLGGRNWRVGDIDWRRRVIRVEPTDLRGVARWSDGGGQGQSVSVATAVRDVLTGSDPNVELSRRATARLTELRDEWWWVRPDATTVVLDRTGASRWWTFAGRRANVWLASLLAPLREHVTGLDAMSIAVDPGVNGGMVSARLRSAQWPGEVTLADWISDHALENLKFVDCIPRPLAVAEIEARLRDDRTVARVRAEPVTTAHRSES